MNTSNWITGMLRRMGVSLLLSLAFAAYGLGQSQFSVDWHTIDGGGGMSGTGGSYSLSGTIGQPNASAASAMTGGTYSLTGGFWVLVLPLCSQFAKADFNRNCYVDADDLGLFEACALGPRVPYDPANLPLGCQLVPVGAILSADFDADGDLDQDDFGVFQRCYSGSNNPADPDCGN